MGYKGRVVFGGCLGYDMPFVGFGLSSKSDSKRELEISGNQVRVVPTSVEGESSLDVAKARSNMYPAIHGFLDGENKPVMVCTNGTMTKRVKGLIEQGMPPEHALISTFQAYKAKKGDPRMGMVARPGKGPSFWAAASDITDGFYFGVQEFNPGSSRINYLSLTGCREIQTVHLHGASIDSLAEQAFSAIFEDDPHAIAAAIMVLKDSREFIPMVYHKER